MVFSLNITGLEIARFMWSTAIFCFLVIAIRNILVRREAKYKTVLKYGIILIVVGLLSILLDWRITTISFKLHGEGLASETIGICVAILGAIWTIAIIYGAWYFVNAWKIFDVKPEVDIFVTMWPVMVVLGTVAVFTSTTTGHQRVVVLREIIFLYIPAITVMVMGLGMIVRKMKYPTE